MNIDILKYKYQCRIAILICVLFTLGSCKSTQKIASPSEPPVAVSPGQKQINPQDYLDHAIRYSTFYGKASIHIQTDNFEQSFTSKIKMRNLRDIWMNGMAILGVEVGQGYITEDSLQAFMRINKTAYQLPYNRGVQLIQAPVAFPMLQNLMIGNPVISDAQVDTVEDRDSTVAIICHKGDIKQLLLYDKKQGNLQEQTITDSIKKFSCRINYSNFDAVNGQRFPKDRTMTIDNGGQTSYMTFEFSNANIDQPVDISFKIPGYCKINTL